MRHGMTFGEIARIVMLRCSRNRRDYMWCRCKNISASPLIADAQRITMSLFTNIDAYYGSSFLTVLSSVAPFDIGIGTDMAFQCLALPEYCNFLSRNGLNCARILSSRE